MTLREKAKTWILDRLGEEELDILLLRDEAKGTIKGEIQGAIMNLIIEGKIHLLPGQKVRRS